MKERFTLKNWGRQHTEVLVAVVLLIFLLVPMLVLCFYAGLSADDFWHPLVAGYRWHSSVPNPAAAAFMLAVGITIFSPNNWLSLNIVENFAAGTIQAQKVYTGMVLAALEAPGNGAVILEIPPQ